jgi:hypothetical protein
MPATKIAASVLGFTLTVAALSYGMQAVDGAHVTGVYCSMASYKCSLYLDKDLIFSGTDPKCATSTGNDARRFQFDGDTPRGKTFLAIALAAQTSGSPVYAEGTGTCLIYTNKVEDLNTIFIHN